MRTSSAQLKKDSTSKRKGEPKIFIRKKKPFKFQRQSFNMSSRFKLKMMALQKSQGLVRSNIFGKEVIHGSTKINYPTGKGKKTFRFVYIFAMVQRDALRWLENNKLKKSDWMPSVHFNPKVKLTVRPIMGTDIDSAYWFMAYRLGVISEQTYEKGLAIPDKNLCLAALAAMGGDKWYNIIKDGVITQDKVVLKGNDELKEVYRHIRHSCYQLMQRLARKLGGDYVCYKTDCIYYFRNDKNRKIVRAFMDKYGLDYKMAERYKPGNLKEW